MQTTIQLDNELAAAIASRAGRLGLTVDAYLRRVLDAAEPDAAAANRAGSSDAVAEYDAALDALFAAETRPLEPTGLTYSREDIYFDHD